MYEVRTDFHSIQRLRGFGESINTRLIISDSIYLRYWDHRVFFFTDKQTGGRSCLRTLCGVTAGTTPTSQSTIGPFILRTAVQVVPQCFFTCNNFWYFQYFSLFFTQSKHHKFLKLHYHETQFFFYTVLSTNQNSHFVYLNRKKILVLKILIKVRLLIFYDFLEFSENLKNVVYHIT